jgi:hypothetical protein
MCPPVVAHRRAVLVSHTSCRTREDTMSSVAQTDSTVVVHDALWPQRVMVISDKLLSQFPLSLHTRITDATEMAKYPKRFRATEGVWVVADVKEKKWFTVNGSCDCGDTAAQDRWCKHRLGVHIVVQAREVPDDELIMEPGPATQPVSPPSPEVIPPPESAPEGEEGAGIGGVTIPPQYIQRIHGKPFVRYAGLLAIAHECGLHMLEATFISVTDVLAVAQATATFLDGRRFVESGDATPENVHFAVRPHFARMALTRAKARALRDALNIGICAVEEME